jgi:hypothetical protein
MRELFRSIAAAQDATLADRRPLEDLAGSVVRPRRVRPRRVALVAALAAGTVLVWGWWGRHATSPPAGEPVVAQADSELPLRFADGSLVTFRSGSRGRVERLDGIGAVVALEDGALEAHVVHAEKTHWTMQAGPFRVHVTGTRFTMTWSRAHHTLAVALHEGAVLVDGAVLGAGVPLRAGQRLTVELDGGRVRTESLVPVPTRPAPVLAAQGSPPPVRDARPRPEEDWVALAESGAYDRALAAAERPGLAVRLRGLDARGLLTLGDVARYAGAPRTAERAFQALVDRFPGEPLAGDALFSLGRLAVEGGRPAEAVRWFRGYVSSWPEGPLAEQAAGRLIECLVRAGDREAARQAARAYLQRAPHGPHAPLADGVLRGEER